MDRPWEPSDQLPGPLSKLYSFFGSGLDSLQIWGVLQQHGHHVDQLKSWVPVNRPRCPLEVHVLIRGMPAGPSTIDGNRS